MKKALTAQELYLKSVKRTNDKVIYFQQSFQACKVFLENVFRRRSAWAYRYHFV